jgi:hypothetical protein
MSSQPFAGQQLAYPLPLDRADVEHREEGSVILEARPLRGSPDRDEVQWRLDSLRAGDGEAQELHVAGAGACFAEDEEGGNELPPRRLAVQAVEDEPQQLVAPARGFVQVGSRLLVVAEVREDAGLRVEPVRPVRVLARGVDQSEPVLMPRLLSPEAEAPPVATGQQTRQRIRCGVRLGPALVDRADAEDGCPEALEGNPFAHCRSIAADQEPGGFERKPPLYTSEGGRVNAKDPMRVDATPARRFFVSMLVRDIELMPAIIDLVDNSADGAKRIRPEAGEDRYAGLRVDVEVSPERFMIEDNCGGMDIELAREYAFKFGRAMDAQGPIGEVGQFGIGMKRALFKMGECFCVKSATEGNRFTLPVDVRSWTAEKGNDWSFRFGEAEEDVEIPEDEVGTEIVVTNLHEFVAEEFGQDRFVNRLRQQIALRELRLLQQGLDIRVNGEPLKAHPPLLLAGDDLSPIHIEEELAVDGAALRMSLWAGLAAEGAGDEDDSDDAEKYRGEPEAGWYVFCNDRLLIYADKGRLTGWGVEAATYHPQYSRFRGYVLLEGDARYMPWNTTKTGVDEDSRIFREVQNQMFDSLQKVQAIVNRLKKERRQKQEGGRPALEAIANASPKLLSDVPLSPAS